MNEVKEHAQIDLKERVYNFLVDYIMKKRISTVCKGNLRWYILKLYVQCIFIFVEAGR